MKTSCSCAIPIRLYGDKNYNKCTRCNKIIKNKIMKPSKMLELVENLKVGEKVIIEKFKDHLFVEKKESEVRPFEDGDILFYPQKVYNKTTFLIQVKGYLFYNEYQDRVFYRSAPGLEGDKRYLANEEQKQLLFDRLAKDGKRWNAETKQLEDLNEPKIGDDVIMWNTGYEKLATIDTLDIVRRGTFYGIANATNNCIKWNGTAEQFNRVRNGVNK